MTATLNEERWQYLANRLPLGRASNVLDIGANPLEEPAYKPLMKAGHARVHGFEPQPEAFAALEAEKGPMEVYYPHAVGDGQPVDFHIYAQSGLSSTLTLDEDSIDFLGRSRRAAALKSAVSVDSKRLDDIEDLPAPDLLKIDVQGAEAQIMAHGRRALRKVMVVITELRFFPLYRQEGRTDAQIPILGDLGLIFHKHLFIKSKMIENSRGHRLRKRLLRTQAIDGDAVFVRDLRRPDDIASEQIAHLAMLADAVFQSYDLAVRCMDILVVRGEIEDAAIDGYIDRMPPAFTR